MSERKARYLDSIGQRAPDTTGYNILLILVDDLGRNDISCYDPEGMAVPHIESLAREGVLFNNAYATSSLCSPSRASLMTGRYQQRFGFERQPMNRYPRCRLEYWVVEKFIDTEPMELIRPMSKPGREEIRKQGIPPGEILISEILQKKSYRTGIFGKWHLGFHESFIPNRRGFEDQYGFYEAFSLYAPIGDPAIVNYRHDYFANRHIWKQKRRKSCAIRLNNRIINEKEYLTFSIADRACRFIAKNRQVPFFLYVPFSAPHTPFQVPIEYYKKYSHIEDENKRVYFGMIAALDDAVGRLLNTLDEYGLREKTFIIFASDNGGATYTDATDNGHLKAGKFSQFEGGIRIPLIFSLRGFLPQGISYSHPVFLPDIFNTALSVAGCALPGDRVYDGVDLMPHILGEDPSQPHESLFWRTDFNRAVRKGRWKLIWNERDNQVFLHDLERDAGESRNLSTFFPEKVKELKSEILLWERGMTDPLWPGVMQFRFIIDGEITWWAI